MIYKAYNNENKLVETCIVKNKKEVREEILTSKRLHDITYIEYGRKQYTISQVYGNF